MEARLSGAYLEKEEPAAFRRRVSGRLVRGTAGAIVAMAVQMIPGLYAVLVGALIAGSALILVVGMISARRTTSLPHWREEAPPPEGSGGRGVG